MTGRKHFTFNTNMSTFLNYFYRNPAYQNSVLNLVLPLKSML